MKKLSIIFIAVACTLKAPEAQHANPIKRWFEKTSTPIVVALLLIQYPHIIENALKNRNFQENAHTPNVMNGNG